MKWSIKLGRFAGIDVFVHVTFLLLLGFIGYAIIASGQNVAAAVDGMLFVCAVFGCVLLHEFGHALTARRYGIRTRDITLLPIGGVARLERMPERPLQELWVALAGPAVNVAIVALLAVWLAITGGTVGPAALDLSRGPMASRLLVVNTVLVLFNMIPAFPMDGGRVLRALLALRMNHARATQIAAALGKGIAMIFAVLGFAGLMGGPYNPLLLFIAVFVWLGATQEAGMAQFRSTVAGATVRDAMLTRYLTLSPEEPLSRAEELVLAGSQQDFPVLDGGRVVGVLTRKGLLNGLSQQGRSAPVAIVMEREFAVLTPGLPLEQALTAQAGRPLTTAPVVERGELIGLLTLDNVNDFLLIQTALRGPASRAAGASVPPVLPGSGFHRGN